MTKITLRQLEEAGLGLSDFYKLSIAMAEGADKEVLGSFTTEQRELIETSQVNATYFVREKIFQAVMEGAEKVRVMRDVLRGSTFKLGGSGKDYRFVLHENRNGTLAEISGTAEYPIPVNESYREVVFQTRKYGEIAVIEDELIDDSMFDVIEMRMRDLGERAENTLNSLCLDVLVSCGNTSNVSYSPTEPFWSIAAAIKQLKIQGFTPDTLLMTATMEGDIYTDPHWRYDYSGEVGNFRTQEIGKRILGLKPWVCTIDSNTSGTFGPFSGSTAYAVRGLVMEANKAGGICFKDDISLDKFNDPKNDLTNVKVRIRFDTECFYGKAICLLR